MEFKVIFLGTAGGVPTKYRSLPCIVFRRGGEVFVFDCGEGAQRQFIISGIGFPSKFRIFISHLHGDHLFGLPGLLQTMSLMGRSDPVEIYGPRGIINFLEALKETVGLNLTFNLDVNEVYDGLILESDEYVIHSVLTEHSIPCLAYSFEEKPKPGRFNPDKALKLGVPKGPLWKRLQKGFSVRNIRGEIIFPEDVLGPPRRGVKVVYSGDTRPCSSLVELARNADMLIHEATFDDSLKGRAVSEGHSTASEAATIALKAGVKLLVLTHISARYCLNDNILLEQAKKIFRNVIIAQDFMTVKIFPKFEVETIGSKR
ncbi:MAG: ribonuclease Z [Candidatus Verstraetearchaeota archaeon]|nr:ribonuclease Z [Candidatus Verstraetearchaeota archaeon]